MFRSNVVQKLASTSPKDFRKALLFTASTLTGAMVAFFSSQNPASALTWVFQNVKFDDGADLIGQFDFSNGEYSNFLIEPTGGDTALFPPFIYSPSTSFVLGSSDSRSLSLRSNATVLVPIFGGPQFRIDSMRSLFIDFAQPLTEAGGSIDLQRTAGLGGDSEFSSLSTSPPFGNRALVSGSVVSVPVPEPTSTIGFLTLSTLSAASILKRNLKSSK
ncbi:PEP-CTERM sorting domain-containing protein [Moorena sp. SIO3B2]|uniref:PEP-CTERM sorting domain-containing protein n=1 Tax=Moorena sp. SIO3B2 TaxID=2607827 RepID=UPI0025799A2E|nr:PEP-CTERM sorting domain-containing protein [Moorena sp. SIO3B2]